MPDHFTPAEVVMLYNKGATPDPANYRQISLSEFLLQAVCSNDTEKAGSHGQNIGEGQFGFRRARSTSQPLYILRRLQDYAEAGGESLYLTVLDWKKCF